MLQHRLVQTMFRWGVGQANQYSVTTSSERTSWTPPGGPTETTPIASVMLTGSVQVMPCDGFRRVPSQDRPTSFSLLAMVCVQHICTFAIKSKSYISIKKKTQTLHTLGRFFFVNGGCPSMQRRELFNAPPSARTLSVELVCHVSTNRRL